MRLYPSVLPHLPEILMVSDGEADMLGLLPMNKISLLPCSSSSSAPSLSLQNSDMLINLDPSKCPIHKGLQTHRPYSPGAPIILSESIHISERSS